MANRRNKSLWLAVDVIVVICCILFLFPMLIGFVNSFKSLSAVLIKPLSMELELFSLDGYRTAFKALKYPTRFLNSAFITIVTLFFVIMLSSMAAYKLSRDNSLLSNTLFKLVLAFILIPFQCTMIPLTVLMTNLNLINTFSGVIAGYIAFLCPMSIFLYHG